MNEHERERESKRQRGSFRCCSFGVTESRSGLWRGECAARGLCRRVRHLVMILSLTREPCVWCVCACVSVYMCVTCHTTALEAAGADHTPHTTLVSHTIHTSHSSHATRHDTREWRDTRVRSPRRLRPSPRRRSRARRLFETPDADTSCRSTGPRARRARAHARAPRAAGCGSHDLISSSLSVSPCRSQMSKHI